MPGAPVANDESTPAGKVAEILQSRPVPGKFSKEMLPLWRCLIVAIVVSATNGFDYSQWNGILNMPYFYPNDKYPEIKNAFPELNVQNGALVGTVNNMYWYGGLLATLFIPVFLDRLGRKGAMMLGCAFCIGGAILDGSAGELAQFCVGRFLLGFGMGIASSAAPSYVAEMAHPAHRGYMTGLYNCFWGIGALLCDGVMLGSTSIQSNWSWRIPLLTQMIPSLIVVSTGWFLPESPRWLLSRGRRDQARSIIAKYHCSGNMDDPLIDAQIEEIEEALQNDPATTTKVLDAVDYRPLFATRATRYRSFVIFIFGFVIQFNGGAMGNYGTLFNRLAGINDPLLQQGLYFGASLWSWLLMMSGANFVDRLGRRTMLLVFLFAQYSNILIQGSLLTAFQKTQEVDATGSAVGGNVAISISWVVMGYFSSAFWCFFFTPLQALYPVEIWNFSLRGRGLAFNNVLSTIAQIVNNYVIPVAYTSIKENLNYVYVCWGVVAISLAYLFIPETKGRTLEELEVIFDAKNPVKASKVGQFQLNSKAVDADITTLKA